MAFEMKFRTVLMATVSSIVLSATLAAAEDAVPLDQVVVSDEQGAAAVDIETTVDITDKDIERTNPQNMRDLFTGTPSVRTTGGSAATQRIYLNGIDQTKLNVQIDGARTNNTVWHHNGGFSIDPYFLKRVEIDPGVSAADHGPGALGGSIRFTSKEAMDLLRPGQTFGATVIGSYDTNSQTYKSTTAGYAAMDGFQFLSILSRAEGQDYENGGGIKEPGTADDLWTGLVKGSYESEDGHKIIAATEYYRDTGIRRLRPNMHVTSSPFFNYNRAERITATFQYMNTKPTDSFDPEVLLYYTANNLDRPNRSGYLAPSGDFNSDMDEFGGKAQNTFSFDFGRITTGFDFYKNRTEIERFHFPNDVSEDIFNAGAFVQARLTPADRLEVSTGFRVDFQSYDAVDGRTFENVGVSPNISAAYELFDGVKIHGGYAYVFGGLEQAETALFHAQNYIYARNLRPSWAQNWKAGVTYDKNGLILGGDVFYTLVEDTVTYQYLALSKRINGPNLKSMGFNLLARYQWENGFIGAAFNHTDVRYGDRIALPGDANTANTVGDTMTVEAAYRFADFGVTVGAYANVAFDFDHEDLKANGFPSLDGYQDVSLFAEWTPTMFDMPNLTLRAEVGNLLDQKYVDRGSFYTFPARTVEPVYAMGRSFMFTGTAKF